MTKHDLAEKLYEESTDLTKRQAAEFVDLVFDVMKKTLASGEEMKVSGFGKWVVKAKKDRTGRNPQTGEPMIIEGRRVISFKVSEILRKRVNSNPSGE